MENWRYEKSCGGIVSDVVDMDMHDGVSIIRIQERQEDRILMARSGRS